MSISGNSRDTLTRSQANLDDARKAINELDFAGLEAYAIPHLTGVRIVARKPRLKGQKRNRP